MRDLINNRRGQAVLPVVTLLMILSLLCTAALTLTRTDQLTLQAALEETQAYYVADAALEKTLSILQSRVKLLDSLQINKTYDKKQLTSLLAGLSGPDKNCLQSLLNLFNESFAVLEISRSDGTPQQPAQFTGAGTIHSLSLTKTAADAGGYAVRLEVTGKYATAKRSLVANVRFSRPVNDLPGTLVQQSAEFINAIIESPLVVLADTDFSADGLFYDGIYIKGGCTLGPAANLAAPQLLATGPIVVEAGAVYTGELKSGGDVLINGDIIDGPVRSCGNVTVLQGHVGRPLNQGQVIRWDGSIYATGSVTPMVSDNFGQAYAATPQAVSYPFPDFPLLDLAWYARHCDYYLSGHQTIRAEDLLPGIYYIQGNLNVSGRYQGNITLVAAGSITIPDSALLQAHDPAADSLLLISAGEISLQPGADVAAALYSREKISLAQQARLQGLLVTRQLACNRATVTYRPDFQNIHPAWVTTRLSIISWQEKYPVFRID
ncbi:hypothetical protein [Desulforamulus hydrothermalis]|uniref:Type 4 fimbrial biogenesis protein PilX N-terminal domain-containing protein n=1 Tax=Desulforamulus hydrothermalis Lam5 = DSM 18033 TaxID=1121428 RepID=K8EB74_9FIRM|nr:hypothetical protein [Desulforamulus hydrothermalis]CCO08873.1 conserved exported hypothetical protein [Desulforamulus hydrothermalis Lam5 = DSM 18033]SHG73716.1 hypothetical protein SAMN02745177_00189 [Desulforamulus hydrothermalis Lam5 = DSM 18033]